MVSLERKCWSNSQYSSHDCLKISRFAESLKKEDLEGTVLKIFEVLNVVVDLSNVEDGCCVASRTSKMVIMKLFRCKDANKICRVKKNFNNGKFILTWNTKWSLHQRQPLLLLQNAME